MPNTGELYEGQAAVVAARLAEAQLLQRADEAEAQAATDPAARASLLRRMASRTGTIGALTRQLARMEADGAASEEAEEEEAPRGASVKIRLSQEEYDRLARLAAEEGLSKAAYIRLMCGLS